ncbi:MAG: T9SS type A sorting domain-containing protein [Bacteroidetes bacterium]|nr:T9SS type A sorting domain-containing protein [Bacteroidota bacterium]
MKTRIASFGMEWFTLLSAAFLKSGSKTKSGISLNLSYFLTTFVFLPMMLFSIEASATKYYLSPTGSDSNPGSLSSPFYTLNKAWTLVSAGDTIYMRGGTYVYTMMQDMRNKSGSSGHYINIWNYPGEYPKITKGSTYSYSGVPSGINLSVVNYIYVKGIEITGFPQPSGTTTIWRGLFADNVNYCKFENLNSHHNGHGMGIAHDSQGNLVLNCDFHNNYDPYSATPYGDGDGFEISSINGAAITGASNVIRGCRSWSNADDGYDTWMSNGLVEFDNCWSFKNGYREDGVTTGGDGNGYKYGETGVYDVLKRKTTNCLSFQNRMRGYTQNYCHAVAYFYNNVSYNNGARGFDFDVIENKAHIFRNNIAYGDVSNSIFLGSGNIIDHNTFGASGSPIISVTNSDFVSVSSAGMDGPRQADGSLPVLTFLHLASTSGLINAGVNVGLPYTGTAPDLGAFEYSSGSANQAPTILNQSFSVNENSANGTTVGTVVATDPNAGQTLTYSILSGNTNNAFTINASTGVLVVANSAALNYEAIISFALVVKVQDNGSGSLSSQATVTVNLINLNEPPVISPQTFTVSENSSNGTSVGTVAATDPDAGQALSFSILSGNTGTAFAINSATGALTVATSSALNFETNPAFSLIVKVQDNGAGTLSSQATVTVNLSNVNEPPVIVNQAFSISENSAIGTLAGNVIASDPDAGQALTYSILSGNTNSAFAINSATGALTVAATSALNFETNPVFILVVKVQDNGAGSLSSQANITVNLLNVNEPPSISAQSFSIAENSTNGSNVGTVVATDPDAGQTLTYSILSGNTNSAFIISASTGVISVASSTALNFEANPTFILVVKVQDNGSGPLSSQANITISLTNVNEAPVLNDQVFNVTELSPVGTIVGNVIATDPDAGQVLTYSLLSGNSSNAFSINSATGVLSVANPTALNMQIYPTFSLTIRATDNGSGNLYDNGIVTVNVLQTGNLPPVITSQTFTVVEHSPNGSVAGVVVASDPNPGQTLTYSILSGNTQNAFAIGANTGILTIADSSKVNFETLNSYSLVIKVQDNGATPMSNQAVDSEIVQDVNEYPVVYNQSFSVADHAANGTNVGTVVATDPDLGQTLTYSIVSGNTNGGFTINASTGLIKVANSAALSYQTTPVFSMVIRVTDNGNGPLHTDATMTINVLPVQVNHAPVISNQFFNVYENLPNGTVLGTIVASDPDPGQTLTYSIASGNINGAFFVNPSNGILTVANSAALNYEAILTFSLSVVVKDNGTTPLSSQATISINLMDVNEPPVINSQSFTVAASAANGTVVGKVRATDPDAGQILTYSITSGNTSGAFTLNSSNGNLVVANTTALNYQTNPSFTLMVKVQDNGTGNLFSQAAIIVNLVQVSGCSATGYITYQIWNNIGNGIAVSALTSNINYPNNPSSTSTLTSMEAATNQSNNYGARIAGYICAPATGNYIFWIAADDNAELWLSTNNQPANKQKIAFHTGWTNSREWNKYTTQRSAAISLIQGQTYYIEALMKEASGGDNLCIGWLKPGQTGTLPSEVVPGAVLSPLITSKSTYLLSIVSTPQDTVSVGSTYTYDLIGFSGNNSIMQYSATTLPNWLSISDHSNGTGTLEGTPGIEDIGDYQIVLKGNDGLLEAVQTFTLKVKETSISNSNQEVTGITVYPNPVSNGLLNVKLDNGIQEQFDLSIMDMAGMTILNRHYENTNSFSIDVSSYPVSQYLILIHSDKFRISKKFVKL